MKTKHIHFSFHSDTLGWGCDVIFQDQLFQVHWSASRADIHINAKQFLPILLALYIRGHLWHHSHLHFHCDNTAVVEVIN